jgi:hypothetical protein
VIINCPWDFLLKHCADNISSCGLLDPGHKVYMGFFSFKVDETFFLLKKPYLPIGNYLFLIIQPFGCVHPPRHCFQAMQGPIKDSGRDNLLIS